MKALMEALGYTFHDPALLARALTHPSMGAEVNQRLEFLGDAVLQYVMSDLLFKTHPTEQEGGLTHQRALLVCEAALAQVARKLGVGHALRMDKGEEQTGGREKPSVLADAMEAILAAVYLDGGLSAAEKFVFSHLKPSLSAAVAGAGCANDFKRILLEYCQSVHTEPEYTEEEKSGPPHNPRYVYAVSVNGELLGRGEGASKIQAQADAAEQALKKLGIDYNLFNRGSK